MTQIYKKPACMAVALLAVLSVSGCGQSQSDRALSGAGIGAGVGAVGSAILAADPVTGAVLGGAVGAATGAMTDKDKIDLGKPFWE